ncbi:hypothetical protein HDV00_008315 [Rhizophlyctis rosea]|nr:hypothetical protein HDV00_008315 [Rhizophlyctis rosea]
MMEAIVPEYDRFGKERPPSGTTLTGIVPTNAYKCKDGKHADDPELAQNVGRVRKQDVIDGAITEWTMTMPSKDVLQALEKAQVPSGPIYSVKDIVEDPHYQARGMLEEVDVKGRKLKVPGISPVLTKTPGGTEWAGPDLGQHTREVLRDLIGLSEASLDELYAKGAI